MISIQSKLNSGVSYNLCMTKVSDKNSYGIQRWWIDELNE